MALIQLKRGDVNLSVLYEEIHRIDEIYCVIDAA
jgi:hypothetical protein